MLGYGDQDRLLSDIFVSSLESSFHYVIPTWLTFRVKCPCSSLYWKCHCNNNNNNNNNTGDCGIVRVAALKEQLFFVCMKLWCHLNQLIDRTSHVMWRLCEVHIFKVVVFAIFFSCVNEASSHLLTLFANFQMYSWVLYAYAWPSSSTASTRPVRTCLLYLQISKCIHKFLYAYAWP